MALAKSGHFSVVQLTNLEKLPRKGSRITIAPLKLQGGSGGPTRVFAQVDSHHHKKHQEYDREKLKRELCEEVPLTTREPQAYSKSSAIHKDANFVVLLLISAIYYAYH